ncbi:sn-glycerol-3-phosphate transport system permease protein UgpE [Clostridia bacterium]|nr:sn-glycerol-3-phosphate transport system permease protein UgpE [Clostridia bacterium]
MSKHQKNMVVQRNIVKTVVYIVCIFLSVLSVWPFLVMFVNATRSTPEINLSQLSLIPSTHLFDNFKVFQKNPTFNAFTGFRNSMVISGLSTILAVYFSSLTAYGIAAYQWKASRPFFTFIMCVMMVPAQISGIGFYQFMYSIGLNNSLLPLILPAVAAPAMVFFMRQYLLATLSIEIVEAARIDGSGEFFTFNRIILPIMVPAIATQAIFSFVGSWNNLFMPMILLTDRAKYTMPIMVSLLRGNIYKVELGAIYLGLALTTLPLFVIYFLLSRYIIAGVALGGVKE